MCVCVTDDKFAGRRCVSVEIDGVENMMNLEEIASNKVVHQIR